MPRNATLANDGRPRQQLAHHLEQAQRVAPPIACARDISTTQRNWRRHDSATLWESAPVRVYHCGAPRRITLGHDDQCHVRFHAHARTCCLPRRRAKAPSRRRAGTQLCVNPQPKRASGRAPTHTRASLRNYTSHPCRPWLTGGHKERKRNTGRPRRLRRPTQPGTSPHWPPRTSASGHKRFLDASPYLPIFGRFKPLGSQVTTASSAPPCQVDTT